MVFKGDLFYRVVKNSIPAAHTESSSVRKCENVSFPFKEEEEVVVGEFWVRSFDTFSDISMISGAIIWGLLYITFQLVHTHTQAHTNTPTLTTVSELVNNSPKRNLNTMNLGD